jgi:hypothetical protein
MPDVLPIAGYGQGSVELLRALAQALQPPQTRAIPPRVGVPGVPTAAQEALQEPDWSPEGAIGAALAPGIGGLAPRLAGMGVDMTVDALGSTLPDKLQWLRLPLGIAAGVGTSKLVPREALPGGMAFKGGTTDEDYASFWERQIRDFAAERGLPEEEVQKLLKPPVTHHGTSADFEKFDTAFMGGGEGSQYRGWGMYTGEHPATAQRYREITAGRPDLPTLQIESGPEIDAGPMGVMDLHRHPKNPYDLETLKNLQAVNSQLQYWRAWHDTETVSSLSDLRSKLGSELDNTERALIDRYKHRDELAELSKMAKQPDITQAELEKQGHAGGLLPSNATPYSNLDSLKYTIKDEVEKNAAMIRAAEQDHEELTRLTDFITTGPHANKLHLSVPPRPGHTYEVKLAAPRGAFLQLGEQLTEQPAGRAILADENARSGIEAMTNQSPYDMKGWEAYKALEELAAEAYGVTGRHDKAASTMLHELGIPGNRFLDKLSREGEAAKTENFVTWDTDIMNILRKYGIPLSALGMGDLLKGNPQVPSPNGQPVTQPPIVPPNIGSALLMRPGA